MCIFIAVFKKHTHISDGLAHTYNMIAPQYCIVVGRVLDSRSFYNGFFEAKSKSKRLGVGLTSADFTEVWGPSGRWKG